MTSKRSTLMTLAAVVIALGLLTSGPAQAAALTQSKVRQIAAGVLQQQAPRLSVARAVNADRASTAASAETLGGRAPEAYLDRVAFAAGPSNVEMGGAPAAPAAGPVSIQIPPGVGFVRVTGIASFHLAADTAILFVARGTARNGSGERTPYSYAGVHQYGLPNLSMDRVLPVTPGATETFVLCAATGGQSTIYTPTLTVETVASGAG